MTLTDGIAAPPIVPRPHRLRTAAWRAIDYAFLRWKIEKGSAPTSALLFRYYQASATLVLYWAVLGSAFLEIPVLHLIIRHWSHWIAWTLSALGIVAIIYIIALIKGMYLLPVVLTDRQLLVRFGIQNEIIIPVESIISIQGAGTTRPDAIRMYKADAPNVRVIFSQGGKAAAVDFFLSEPTQLMSAYTRGSHRTSL